MIPPRLRVAAELLGPGPAERVLEIGCGRGVLAALLVDRVGHYVGVDRSATAVEATSRRIGEAVAAGRAEVVRAGLAELDPAVWGPCDRVLAVNVNVFWTGRATRELAVVRGLLGPGGGLDLVYGSDDADPRPDLADRLGAHLAAGGFTPAVDRPSRSGVRLLTVHATTE